MAEKRSIKLDFHYACYAYFDDPNGPDRMEEAIKPMDDRDFWSQIFDNPTVDTLMSVWEFEDSDDKGMRLKKRGIIARNQKEMQEVLAGEIKAAADKTVQEMGLSAVFSEKVTFHMGNGQSVTVVPRALTPK